MLPCKMNNNSKLTNPQDWKPGFIELRPKHTVDYISQYTCLIEVIKKMKDKLMDGNSVLENENLESDSMKRNEEMSEKLNFFERTIRDAFSSVTIELLSNLEYSLKGILDATKNIQNITEIVSVEFLKFLEKFAQKCDKEISLYENFVNTFDKYAIVSPDESIRIFFNVVFIGDHNPNVSFYRLSVFYTYAREQFKSDKYIIYIARRLVEVYLINLFNYYEVAYLTKDITENDIKEVSKFIEVKINAINGAISRRLLNSSNLDITVFMYSLILITRDKIPNISNYSDGILFFCVLCSSYNFRPKMCRLIEVFIVGDLRWDLSVDGYRCDLLELLKIFKPEFKMIIRSLYTISIPFFDPKYNNSIENSRSSVIKTRSGVIYTHLLRDIETPYSSSSSLKATGISPFNSRIKRIHSTSNESPHINARELSFD